MKKFFILTSVLALGALSSFAQGTINAANSGTGIIITIQDTTGQVNGGAVQTIGKPATAAFGAAAGPGQVALTLYAAPTGTAFATLINSTNIIASGANSASGIPSVQGTEAIGPSPFILNQSYLQGSDEFVFYGVTGDGKYSAFSVEATGITPATGSTTAPFLFGTQSVSTGITGFNLVPAPEPSTIALGGLGAAALLLFRRRK